MKIWILIIVATFAYSAARAAGFAELSTGQLLADHIVAIGQYSISLPAGRWTVVGKSEVRAGTQSGSSGTPSQLSIALANNEGEAIRALFIFRTPAATFSAVSRWNDEPCKAFQDPLVKDELKASFMMPECFTLSMFESERITSSTTGAIFGQTARWLQSANVSLPNKLVRVYYAKYYGGDFLEANMYFPAGGGVPALETWGRSAAASMQSMVTRQTKIAALAALPEVRSPMPAEESKKILPVLAEAKKVPQSVGSPSVSNTSPVPAIPSVPGIAAPTIATSDHVAKLQLEVDDLRKRLSSPPVPAPVPVAPMVATKGKVRALVIGNSAYVSFGRLPNPRNDAHAIARKLQAMGIDVDLALDLDRDAFVRALNQYSAKAVGQDVNILYYAGHGVQVEGINYLVPTNMSADGVSAGYIKLNGISLNAALDYLPAKTRLVFLDACRDNPVSRNLSATRGSGGVGLAPVGTASGTLIAYATKDGATADDGAGGNSPYTLGLLEHLGKAQDIAVILRQVRQTVMRLTSNRQEPWEYGSLVGDQLILSQIAR